jgi:phospholipid/cholesterol/gamma-HCH transport system substrate-binding protein
MLRRRPPDDADRVPRRERTGFSPFAMGAIALVVIAIIVFFGFAKHVPFTHGFRVKAVFSSAVSIRPNSPVRIAGVNVGKVKSVARRPGTDASVVTMQIDDKGLPIHKDATMKIRPRIFLEGNFFVDLKPGTPSAPTISDDDTLPITQTSTPVQLDQVLTALQQNSREDLQAALEGYGTALTAKPTPAEDAAQDPSVRGDTAAQALNKSFDYAPDALRGTAVVNSAFLGTQADDLSRLVKGLGTVSRSLDRNETQLQDLVTNFNTTMAAFASRSTQLSATVRDLAPALQTTDSTLTHLNASFPATRAFAKEILPGVRETPATIKASFPWIAQARPLLSKAELGGLAQDLQPATADLSKVSDASLKLFPQADLLSQCVTKVFLPAGDVKIQDGNLTTGVENYKEFWYALVGLAGEGANFDGNGMYVRFATGTGGQVVSSGKVGVKGGGDVLYGKTSNTPVGTRPAFPGSPPPKVSTVPCKDQKVPDANSAKIGPADGASTSAAVARSAAATRSVRAAAAKAVKSAGAAANGKPASGASPTRSAAGHGSVISELLSSIDRIRSTGGAAKGGGTP